MERVRKFLSESAAKIRDRVGSVPAASRAISSKVLQKANATSLWDSLRSPEIRQKIIITLGLLIVYRIMAAVPIPGINVRLFNEVFGGSALNSLFTLVTAGRLDNPSIVAIGLGAYINASIIIQLLTTVIPKLEELSKEGERGKRVLNQYTRLLAVPLTVIQAFVIYTILRNIALTIPELAGIVAETSTFDIVVMISALTAGSVVLMWIGELISEYGIGNGVSVIITVSILSVLPGLIARDFGFVSTDFALLSQTGNLSILLNENFLLIYAVIIGFYILVTGIVFINEAVRKVAIHYARRVRGTESTQTNYLPLKINQAGVMPVIFASALLTFPQILTQLLLNLTSEDSGLYKFAQAIQSSFLGSQQNLADQNFFYYELSFFTLIILFTFFYTFVSFKPSETAENLKKSGGFIPGIRPGKETEHYITRVLMRLTFIGAFFLAIVAIIPSLVRLSPLAANLSIFSGIGGTSILIIVGVIIDTIRQMKALTVTRSYDKYR